MKTLMPKDSLSKFYYAFAYPYMSYGIEVYANACNDVLDKLNKANNKILRIILSKKYDTPSVELYKDFNVLSIPMLHEMKLLQLVYKFYHCKSILPEIFQSYFMTNDVVHYHNTRSKFNLHISSVNSTFGQRSSTYRGSKYWNELPECLKQCSSFFYLQNKLNSFYYRDYNILISYSF